MMNWIKCSDRLPEKDSQYLTSDGYSYHLSEYYQKKWEHESEYWLESMSHWMELPKLPE